MYRWLDVRPCDVHHFSSLKGGGARTWAQAPSTIHVAPHQSHTTIPRSHRRSCHDAFCDRLQQAAQLTWQVGATATDSNMDQ